MAVMLRAVHIPSRVVTGFQSGVYNPMTGWHVLRASDAHSWVEAWVPGHGWMTFDPTPPANSPQGKPWSAMALYLDAAEMWWQRWVMDYDLDHQLYLASRFEQSTRNWKGISTDGWMKRLARRCPGLSSERKSRLCLPGVLFFCRRWSVVAVALADRGNAAHDLISGEFGRAGQELRTRRSFIYGCSPSFASGAMRSQHGSRPRSLPA